MTVRPRTTTTEKVAATSRTSATRFSRALLDNTLWQGLRYLACLACRGRPWDERMQPLSHTRNPGPNHQSPRFTLIQGIDAA
jgi:hypothetical protein